MSKRDDIMDSAEAMIRTSGFNAFSFRDIAAETGIKSASVHYHFPTKADLGVAVAKRYTDRFVEALGGADQFRLQNSGAVRDVLKQAFRDALLTDGKMCLCGMLSAEVSGLPDEVAASTRDFFLAAVRWTTDAFAATVDGGTASYSDRETIAYTLLSRLEGAMLVARAMDDLSLFDRVTARLM